MATDSPRVLVAGKIHQAGIDLLKSRKGLSVDLVEAVTTDAYRPYLGSADAILIRTQPMTEAEIALAPKLKIVSRHGVGFDAVDVNALSARDIPLAIVGDVNSRAVAEHTLMLMLAVARRTVAHHIASTTGSWNERNRFDAVELDGKTLLVLGFGRIGRRVAELAKAFGMTVMAYDPYVSADQVKEAGVTSTAELTSALSSADYVSVHMPGGQGPVIGTSELALMKPTAIVINTARGGVVDEYALDLALRERRIRAAGLDVFEQEPPVAGSSLLNNPFLTVSPHNAGLTEECAMRMALAAAQNILDLFDGRLAPELVVNRSALTKAS
jgi:D-3-phosphoglycerate dehydrogenase